ncbi:hypothetical protein Tco_0940626 [Tanacetum coccineum]|uniref:Uncharacterized protein n=1 Tax=Tanacetum coccineum TaxID=301880 RepID=A0ABQ5DNI5_9ASTR
MGCDENRMSINLAAAVFVAVSILKALKTEDLSRKLEFYLGRVIATVSIKVPTGRFGEGVVISCFCVHFSPIAYSLSLRKSLPELFVSSHGGTMTMSLMHQWHDTICGGVISPRRSLLEHMDAS